MKYFFYLSVFAALCIVVSTTSGSASVSCSSPHQPFDAIVLLISSVSVELDIASDQITDALQNDIIDAIANLMTEYCPIDCEACRMASTCGDFLAMCTPFTISYVDLSIVSDGDSLFKRSLSTLSGRQTDGTTIVSISVSIPTGAPLLTSNTPPVISADTLASAILLYQGDFATVTGVNILDAYPNYGIGAVLNFDLIAAIVLPIVVVLLVITLILGIIITIILSVVIKAKIKNKIGSGDKD